MCGPCARAEVRINPPSIHSTYSPRLTLLFLLQPERVGDECASCGKCNPNCWRRSKKLVRADGTPAPLCLSPCYTEEVKEMKKEAQAA